MTAVCKACAFVPGKCAVHATALRPTKDDQAVWILYKNWRNKTAWRHVRPISIGFEATVHHPEAQWLLHGIDLEKRVPRSFAMLDIAKMQKRRPVR